MDHALEFYATPAGMTALPFETLAAYLGELPRDSAAAAEVVRGVLVHRDWAPLLGLTFDDARVEDQQLRPMDDVVKRIVELHDAPLNVERKFPDRMVGVCRHFATLHVALLRNAGIPARARVGFARYFDDGWGDHWITEWWDGARWVKTDAQVGTVAAKLLQLKFDPADQPKGEFLTGAEAWLRCRAGEEDPNRFGIFDLRGLFFITTSITQDLAAVNKIELLPWDGWGVTMGYGPGWEPTAAELAHLDALAELIVEDDFDRLRKRFAEPDVAVPETITSMYLGESTPITLDPSLLAI
jgi:hypothetical protein